MEVTPAYLVILVVAAFILTRAGILVLLPYLKRRAVLDVPNERSNHQAPTPRGGGLVVVIVAVVLAQGLGIVQGAHLPGAVALSALLLMLVSWRDDVKGLSPSLRLIVQFLAVLFAWPALHNHMPPQGISIYVELPLVVFCWMWFTNLYNFMDGIDEITAVESVSIAVGIFVVYIASPTFTFSLVEQGLIIAGAVAAFWQFNRHPAKLFLGDSGSIPLGFLMGWLLFMIALKGFWAAALILPAYYLADSGITLLRRIARRENLLKAHSSHFYQRAVAGGRGHRDVTQAIMRLNLLLIALAGASALDEGLALPALLAAYGLTGALLCYFSKAVKPANEA